MSSMRRPAFLWKATSVDPVSLDLAEILTAGEAAIGGPLSRRLAVEGNVALRHEQEPFTVCWIAGLDHGFAEKDATLGLPDDPLDQRAIVCRFLDAGIRRCASCSGGRRPKSAKARSRGKFGAGWAASAMGI